MSHEAPTIAVLLCAGLGTRLKGLTDGPKAMVDICGYPLLHYQLRQLKRCGIRDAWINLHDRSEAIVKHFGNGRDWGVRIRYWPELHLRGTAGALSPMRRELKSTFLVVYGDVLHRLDYRRFLAAHRARRVTATLGVYRVPDPWNCGVTEIGRNGRIQGFVEKPQRQTCGSPWVNSGVYALEPAVLRWVPSRRPADFGRDVFPQMLSAGEPLNAYRVRSAMVDVGIPEKYRIAQTLAARGAWQQ